MSGVKHDSGKIKAALLADFSSALNEIAKVGTHGADKYSRQGWLTVENGQERYTDAMWRHLLAHGSGETLDPESGLSHFAHFAWNALAVLELELRGAGR
jgi:Domain of unknown function (DUF5664)